MIGALSSHDRSRGDFFFCLDAFVALQCKKVDAFCAGILVILAQAYVYRNNRSTGVSRIAYIECTEGVGGVLVVGALRWSYTPPAMLYCIYFIFLSWCTQRGPMGACSLLFWRIVIGLKARRLREE